MRYEKNAPVYYVPFARLIKDWSATVYGSLKQGAEYCIYAPDSVYTVTNFDTSTVPLQVIDKNLYGNMITPVPLDHLQLFVKIVIPKFKRGDIICDKEGIKNGLGAFRVWEYEFLQGDVWYRNGWSVGTGYEAGVREERMRVATADESKSWTVAYEDDIVKEKKPLLYSNIIKS